MSPEAKDEEFTITPLVLSAEWKILRTASESFKPITTEQQKKIDELTAENAKLKQQSADAEQKAKDAINENIGKKSETKKPSEAFKKAANNFRKLKQKPFTFKDENGNDIPLQQQGYGWNDLVELGAKVIFVTSTTYRYSV